MDNTESESKKNKKNRKVPKKSTKTSSEQKENVPKNEKDKVKKPDPDDCIAKSKLLLLKKNKASSKRRSKHERICPNGKPMPPLSKLKKFYEDSDDDNNDTSNRNDNTPNSNKSNNSCTSPTPDMLLSNCDNKTNLISPSTIQKISEKMEKLIENISDPSKLLEVLPIELDAVDGPPPPIIPPKKRKKPEVPYIVGCKDRPQVPSKKSTNFCKGDSDYGISAADADPEGEEPKRKRPKKSNIPNYSKSSFNALSDEISKKLTETESGNVSDCSSDSNKTVEYDVPPYTPYQPPKPRPFSPLPSTSRDRETFIKNDERFNESLKGIEAIEQSSPKKEQATEHSNEKVDETTTDTEVQHTDTAVQHTDTEVQHTDTVVQHTDMQNDNEVEIIDVPYDTIVIDEYSDSFSQKQIKNEVEDGDLLQKLESEGIQVPKPKETISNLTNDEDCIIITNDTLNEEPIIIEDEYSSINDFTLNEKYDGEILDVDDIINENKSILNKWKNKTTELNQITTVTEVPDNSQNMSTLTSIAVTDPISNCLSNSHIDQDDSVVVVECLSPPREIEDSPIPPRLQQNNQNQQTWPELVDRSQEVPQSQSSIFKSILDDFFNYRAQKRANRRPVNNQQLDNMLLSMGESRRNNNSCQTRSVNTVANHTAINNIPIGENSQSTPTKVCTAPVQTISTPQPPSPEPKRSLGNCPICLDSLTSSGIASTLCGHVFCVDCIKTAIRQNGKKCPTCRKALKGPNGGYHLLYL